MPPTNPANPASVRPPRSRPGPLRWAVAIVLLLLAGWAGWQAYRAHEQRKIREAIEEQGGTYAYDFESREPGRTPTEQGILANVLGNDYTQDIVEASLRKNNRGSFADEDLQQLSTLSALERLSISNGAEVTDEGLALLAKMPKLRILKLIRFPNITDEGLAVVARLPELREIELIDLPKITDAALAHAAELEHLEKVTLNNCPIDGSGWRHLRPAGLTLVDATSCQVNDEAFKHLAGATDLQELAAAQNKIHGSGLAHLNGLTNLTKLRLAENPLDPSEAVSHLKAIESLEMLNLNQTPLDRKAGEELSQALPKCDITITGGNYDPDEGKWQFESGE